MSTEQKSGRLYEVRGASKSNWARNYAVRMNLFSSNDMDANEVKEDVEMMMMMTCRRIVER